MKIRHTLLHSACALAAVSGVQAASYVPLPAVVQPQNGKFTLSPNTVIRIKGNLLNEARWLSSRLSKTSGMSILPAQQGNGIFLSIDPALPAEGYVLDITPEAVKIRGGSAAGVFYGCVTFMQSLPAAVFGNETLPKEDWTADAVHIEDSPATTWRGLHLDSARHFQPKAFILKFIDAMAAQKLNRLHWHLVDCESWRMEVKKYPKLAHVTDNAPAYWPQEIPTNPTVRPKYRYGYLHGGGFYTQADIKEIVAYAQQRHVTIVPEIEFPGHAMAALNAYPEFGVTGKIPLPSTNISPDLFSVKPETIQFLKDVLDETMALFPGKWIHFGGDEAPKQQWKNDPYTQKKIDELKLRVPGDQGHASEDLLQAWLFNEMAQHVAKKGRVAVGWEEITHGKNSQYLPKNAVIMPWVNPSSGITSANQGFDIIHTSYGMFYLDTYQSNDPREPSALYDGVRSMEAIYSFNLYPDGLTPEGKKHVIGAQAQLWTELMPRTDDVEYQAYPRACALAELTWTKQEQRNDVPGFQARVAEHGARLTALGLNHRHMPPPATASWNPDFLNSKKEWKFKINGSYFSSGKTISVNFRYQSGQHALNVQSVELLAGDNVIAKDEHAGFAGGRPNNTSYQLTLPNGQNAGDLSLRVKAHGEGGNDSHGVVEIQSKP